MSASDHWLKGCRGGLWWGDYRTQEVISSRPALTVPKAPAQQLPQLAPSPAALVLPKQQSCWDPEASRSCPPACKHQVQPRVSSTKRREALMVRALCVPIWDASVVKAVAGEAPVPPRPESSPRGWLRPASDGKGGSGVMPAQPSLFSALEDQLAVLIGLDCFFPFSQPINLAFFCAWRGERVVTRACHPDVTEFGTHSVC